MKAYTDIPDFSEASLAARVRQRRGLFYIIIILSIIL